MSFKKISGQQKAVRTLQGFIKSGRIPRAMIFYGPAGVGKASAALEFAKALNCLDSSAVEAADCCGVCQNCVHIDGRTHPDVIFADFAYQAALRGEEVEKQQTIKVDTVRALTSASQQKAVFARWKVYIIDSAEKLLEEGANALLKFIEEPAPNTVWILISSKREAMLSTIKSRCQSVAFAPLNDETLLKILIDGGIETSVAKRAISYAAGSSASAFAAAEIISEFDPLESGVTFASKAALSLPRTLALARAQVSCALDMLSVNAHRKWVSAETEKQKEDLGKLLSKIVFYKKALNRNVSPSLVLEAALIACENLGIDLKGATND
jgi:DNA polymerase III, gamma/tau subunits